MLPPLNANSSKKASLPKSTTQCKRSKVGWCHRGRRTTQYRSINTNRKNWSSLLNLSQQVAFASKSIQSNHSHSHSLLLSICLLTRPFSYWHLGTWRRLNRCDWTWSATGVKRCSKRSSSSTSTTSCTVSFPVKPSTSTRTMARSNWVTSALNTSTPRSGRMSWAPASFISRKKTLSKSTCFALAWRYLK